MNSFVLCTLIFCASMVLCVLIFCGMIMLLAYKKKVDVDVDKKITVKVK